MAETRGVGLVPAASRWALVLAITCLVVHRAGVAGQIVTHPGTTPPNPCGANRWFCGIRIIANRTRPECLPMEFRCDGKIDCISSENDEHLCATVTGSACNQNQTACLDEDCIPNAFVCDRVQDCSHDEDEANCTYSPCSKELFSCKNERHCLPMSAKCNGILDCGDGSDEADELCKEAGCPLGKFKCKNNDCIDQNLVCSGISECSDGSDEDPGCSVNECANVTQNKCSHPTLCKNINIGYKCGCPPGFELKADKRTCQDVDECTQTPLNCSQFCKNSEGSFSCSCTDGYALDNEKLICLKTDDIDPFLIFANRYMLRMMSLNGTILGHARQEHEYLHVLDYDYNESGVYYSDVGKGQIKRMNLNGTGEKVIIRHNLPLVEGLAVDWVNNKLYWTDSKLAGLFVANTNGTYVKTLHTTRTKLPRAIIVLPSRGLLFWTDWSLGAFIGRIHMDGTNMEKLIEEGLFWPNALTIDYITERLWWADAHLDKIETARIDGTGRYAVMVNLPHIYGISVFEDWMYWTDWNIKTIEKANRFTGKNRQQLAKMTHQPYDIHVVHPLRQMTNIVNPCDNDNGGCSHLCLLAPGVAPRKPAGKCACPNHFILKPDNKTCEANCNKRSQFECGRSDHRCISQRWVCDGSNDCAGGEDELDCPPRSPCKTAGTFECASKTQCVRDPRDVCDKVEDCSDGSDENKTMCEQRVCLPSEFRCTSGRCLDASWKCDSDDDCPDGDDEHGCDALRNCTLDEFTCGNGKCIPQLWVCDVDDDCGDRTDELRPQCTGLCRHGWSKCANNYRCVPNLMLCDGDDDCRDNSDENPANCPSCGNGEWECTNKKCIPERWRCDFQDDCGDKSDEDVDRCRAEDKYQQCVENEFRCANEKCIRERFLCDQDDDCGDNSDEKDCANHQCQSGLWQCTSGHCILESFRCDGQKHCQDLTDESGCPTRFPNGAYCPEHEFQCNNTVCAPMSWVCDADDDCGDRSDEDLALCASRPCDRDDRFRCKNNYCIHRSALCDSIDDCRDGSDETFAICPPSPFACDSGKFKCTNNRCVPMTMVCNGRNDCTDMSDEDGCHTAGATNCTTNKGGCEKMCTTMGNQFFCSCNSTGLQIDPANKKLCIDINECLLWKSHWCDQVCNNTYGGFFCTCAAGFRPVIHPGGQVCKSALVPTETVLLAMEGSIHQFRLSHEIFTDATITTRSKINAIDVDGARNLVYWTDPIRKSVFRALVATSVGQLPITQDLLVYNVGITPDSIAIDWVTSNMYITDKVSGKIVVGKTDGRYMRTIIAPSLRRPTRIAVSPKLGLLFWVDSENKKIESAWMDGSHIKAVVTVNLTDPTSIVVDHYMNSRLFWVDMKRQVIESANVDGTNRVIVNHAAWTHPFALDVFESQLYWFSRRNQTLYQFDKFSRGIKRDHKMRSNLLYPQDIKVMHSQKQPPPAPLDRCRVKGCFPLCVLIPNGARCLCPDGSKMIGFNQCDTTPVFPRKMPTLCVCQNGGTCVQQIQQIGVLCLCLPGFTGSNCSQAIGPGVSTSSPGLSKPTTQAAGSNTPLLSASSTLEMPHAKGHMSENTTKIIVPIIVIAIILLVIIIIIVVILHRRGVIGRKTHGVFRQGSPGQENGAANPNYEAPVVTYNPQDGGQANASFNNPYYEAIDEQSGKTQKSEQDHDYATIGLPLATHT